MLFLSRENIFHSRENIFLPTETRKAASETKNILTKAFFFPTKPFFRQKTEKLDRKIVSHPNKIIFPTKNPNSRQKSPSLS
jgi:hypothetical protein